MVFVVSPLRKLIGRMIQAIRRLPRCLSGPSRKSGLPFDQTLASEREPPLGAHVVTPRRGYTLHGIYVGLGRVVHYRGLSRGLGRGPVEEVSPSEFAQGRPVWPRLQESSWPNGAEMARRARSRLG
jgi:hypothetical protein